MKTLHHNILIFISIAFLLACSQPQQSNAYKKSIVFKELLQQTTIDTQNDDVIYVCWKDASCYSCRYTAKKLIVAHKDSTNKKIRLIIPTTYINMVKDIEELTYWDNNNTMFQKYFGIDNVGIINVKDGEVVSITNYNANEMNNFKDDFYTLLAK